MHHSLAQDALWQQQGLIAYSQWDSSIQIQFDSSPNKTETRLEQNVSLLINTSQHNMADCKDLKLPRNRSTVDTATSAAEKCKFSGQM